MRNHPSQPQGNTALDAAWMLLDLFDLADGPPVLWLVAGAAVLAVWAWRALAHAPHRSLTIAARFQERAPIRSRDRKGAVQPSPEAAR